MRNPYDVMGLPTTATFDEIKATWRRLRGQLHTDRSTGDHVKFVELKDAYETLSDPARRQEYDTTGTTSAIIDMRAEAEKLIPQILMEVLGGVEDVEWSDIKSLMWRKVTESLIHDRSAHTQMMKAKVKLEKVLARFSRKGGGENFVASMLNEQLKTLANGLDSVAKHQLFLGEVLDVLKDYEYITGAVPEPEPLQLEKPNAQPS